MALQVKKITFAKEQNPITVTCVGGTAHHLWGLVPCIVVSFGCYNKYHRLGSLNNRNILSGAVL